MQGAELPTRSRFIDMFKYPYTIVTAKGYDGIHKNAPRGDKCGKTSKEKASRKENEIAGRNTT